MATEPSSSATAAVSTLSLEQAATQKTAPKSAKKVAAVADSWEDEDDSEPDTDEQGPPGPAAGERGGSGFAAPPPTPKTPSHGGSGPGAPWLYAATDQQGRGRGAASPERRPEKTDAVARRMIASALGVKAPRATEEQRAYDRALREKERKRREEEKAAERRKAEEAEKAKAAIWED